MTKNTNIKKIKVPKNNKEDKATLPPSQLSPFQQLSKEDQENLNKFFNSLILPVVEKPKKEAETIEELVMEKESKRDFVVLAPMISEFLKSYILIGYSLGGERVVLSVAKTQEQRDALLEQLRLVFMNFMNNHD